MNKKIDIEDKFDEVNFLVILQDTIVFSTNIRKGQAAARDLDAYPNNGKSTKYINN
ncbi:hypothetical protein Ga0451573_000397 [Peptococcaceae bacterium DYL19]|nr:hypothetical protein [Phosphitispora fastidiosa]